MGMASRPELIAAICWLRMGLALRAVMLVFHVSDTASAG